MPFGLQPEVLEQIRSVFAGYPEVETVILYGSRAKGNFKPGSDVDLTFKGKGLDLTVLNRIDNELDDLLLPWSFDLSIYSQIESRELIDHIERAGVVFYQRKGCCRIDPEVRSAGDGM
jgi:uncharacterized protein